MSERKWKRFSYYLYTVRIFFFLNIILLVVNTELKNVLPRDIVSSSFFLSLGLFLGFSLCHHEIYRKLFDSNK